MEEHRIGHMYLNLIQRWFVGAWDGLFPRGLRRSPLLPLLIVILVIGLPGLGYYLHMRGQFHILKSEIKGEQVTGPPAARPGGADPVVLTRQQTIGGETPEFRSATLLPGLGMDVLQITAAMPGKGEMQLLAAPTAEELANGTAPPRSGVNDSHGALELPWGGLLMGAPTPVGTTLRATWHGRSLEVPLDAVGRGISSGGLLTTQSADQVQTTTQGLGHLATAVFRNTDMNQHWPSKTDVQVAVTLGVQTLDLTITAKNVGDQPEPMGMGWHPRFLVPGGNRDSAELRLPGGEQQQMVDRLRGISSGRFEKAGAAVQRFQGHASQLGSEGLDETLVHLKPGLLDSGAAAEVRFPASGYGVRMTAVSSNISTLRVTSPAGSNYVSMGTQTNFDDPLGREWNGADVPGIVTLMPGQTMEWKVRLEIFTIGGRSL